MLDPSISNADIRTVYLTTFGRLAKAQVIGTVETLTAVKEYSCALNDAAAKLWPLRFQILHLNEVKQGLQRMIEEHFKDRARWILTLLSVLAIAVAAKAAPKWPSIGKFATADGGTATVFVDAAGVTRHGDSWTARQKTLFTSPQKTATGASFRSEAEVYAYDCKGNRAAPVSYTRYEGENLGGTVVDQMERSSPNEYEWTTPSAETALDAARKLVCGFAAMISR